MLGPKSPMIFAQRKKCVEFAHKIIWKIHNSPPNISQSHATFSSSGRTTGLIRRISRPSGPGHHSFRSITHDFYPGASKYRVNHPLVIPSNSSPYSALSFNSRLLQRPSSLLTSYHTPKSHIDSLQQHSRRLLSTSRSFPLHPCIAKRHVILKNSSMFSSYRHNSSQLTPKQSGAISDYILSKTPKRGPQNQLPPPLKTDVFAAERELDEAARPYQRYVRAFLLNLAVFTTLVAGYVGYYWFKLTPYQLLTSHFYYSALNQTANPSKPSDDSLQSKLSYKLLLSTIGRFISTVNDPLNTPILIEQFLEQYPTIKSQLLFHYHRTLLDKRMLFGINSILVEHPELLTEAMQNVRSLYFPVEDLPQYFRNHISEIYADILSEEQQDQDHVSMGPNSMRDRRERAKKKMQERIQHRKEQRELQEMAFQALVTPETLAEALITSEDYLGDNETLQKEIKRLIGHESPTNDESGADKDDDLNTLLNDEELMSQLPPDKQDLINILKNLPEVSQDQLAANLKRLHIKSILDVYKEVPLDIYMGMLNDDLIQLFLHRMALYPLYERSMELSAHKKPPSIENEQRNVHSGMKRPSLKHLYGVLLGEFVRKHKIEVRPELTHLLIAMYESTPMGNIIEMAASIVHTLQRYGPSQHPLLVRTALSLMVNDNIYNDIAKRNLGIAHDSNVKIAGYDVDYQDYGDVFDVFYGADDALSTSLKDESNNHKRHDDDTDGPIYIDYDEYDQHYGHISPSFEDKQSSKKGKNGKKSQKSQNNQPSEQLNQHQKSHNLPNDDHMIAMELLQSDIDDARYLFSATHLSRMPKKLQDAYPYDPEQPGSKELATTFYLLDKCIGQNLLELIRTTQQLEEEKKEERHVLQFGDVEGYVKDQTSHGIDPQTIAPRDGSPSKTNGGGWFSSLTSWFSSSPPEAIQQAEANVNYLGGDDDVEMIDFTGYTLTAPLEVDQDDKSNVINKKKGKKHKDKQSPPSVTVKISDHSAQYLKEQQKLLELDDPHGHKRRLYYQYAEHDTIAAEDQLPDASPRVRQQRKQQQQGDDDTNDEMEWMQTRSQLKQQQKKDRVKKSAELTRLYKNKMALERQFKASKTASEYFDKNKTKEKELWSKIDSETDGMVLTPSGALVHESHLDEEDWEMMIAEIDEQIAAAQNEDNEYH